jgi:hypothetical protein
MRRQVDLDRLNADNVRFRPEIEDLGGKRMGDGDDGEIRLFAQIEPQSQGTMCREVSNKDVRQRTVVIFLVGGVLTRRAVCVLHSAVYTLDINVGRRRFVGRMFGLRLGLFVLGPDEGAFDPHRAVMIEDHESATRRDIVGIIGVPFGFQPLDVSLKLAKSSIHMIRKFIGRLVPFG